MDISAIPYLLVSRELDSPLDTTRVYICLCLLDHMILGIGIDRETAMQAMIVEFEAKYGDKELGGDLDVDNYELN